MRKAMVTPAPTRVAHGAFSWPREAGRRRGHLRLINFDKVIHRARRAANNGNGEPGGYAQVCSFRNGNRALRMPWALVPIGRASLGGCGQTQASERDAARHQRPGNDPIGGHGGFLSPHAPARAESSWQVHEGQSATDPNKGGPLLRVNRRCRRVGVTVGGRSWWPTRLTVRQASWEFLVCQVSPGITASALSWKNHGRPAQRLFERWSLERT